MTSVIRRGPRERTTGQAYHTCPPPHHTWSGAEELTEAVSMALRALVIGFRHLHRWAHLDHSVVEKEFLQQQTNKQTYKQQQPKQDRWLFSGQLRRKTKPKSTP